MYKAAPLGGVVRLLTKSPQNVGSLLYWVMLRKRYETQAQMEFVSIEELVPCDHLLCKIHKAISFDFIHEKVEGLYCSDNGRPAIDPVVLFKMLFIGYLFGIRSERQLVKEVEVNIAYRWLLGFSLRDKVPSHSTFSKNRQRRFNDSPIHQEKFDEIVWQAMKRKMVSGRILYTDSTHLTASANKNKFDKQRVEKSTRDYLDALEADVDEDRQAHGYKPLKKKARELEVKESKVSTTDPDSGYMFREGKPKGFFYLDHRAVDGKHNIITDTHVTPGNVHDSIPYLGRLDHQRERFGFGVEDRGISGALAYSRPVHRKGYLPKSAFIYDEHFDCYLCPKNYVLKYRATTREGYREYVSDPMKCTQSVNQVKVVTRHVWQNYKDRVNEHRYYDWGKRIYKRRQETVERSFADSKQLHGHRYARMRGIDRVREQCLLAAAYQNMKKIA